MIVSREHYVNSWTSIVMLLGLLYKLDIESCGYIEPLQIWKLHKKSTN